MKARTFEPLVAPATSLVLPLAKSGFLPDALLPILSESLRSILSVTLLFSIATNFSLTISFSFSLISLTLLLKNLLRFAFSNGDQRR